MPAIDFARSYMTWFGENEGSMSRIQLEAACTIIDESSGTSDTYYLIAPCRAEHTHSDEKLIVMPNYDFRGIFGEKEHIIIRTHWVTEPDYLDDPELDSTGGRTFNQAANNLDRWGDVRLDIQRFADSTALETNEQIVDATLANKSFVGRTEIRDDSSGTRAVMEYPIKTMNVLKKPMRYQVDTGPIIVPDFGSTAGMQVERFDIAHVVYNRPEKGEFILRRPKEIVEGGKPLYSVTDYSMVLDYQGSNVLLSAG
jgi:hypothetical protein